MKKGTKKKLSKKCMVGNLKRSAEFTKLEVEDSSSSPYGVSQEHEVAKAPRTLLCPQRRVSVPVRRTDISTHAAQVNRGRQSHCVAQTPTCPDPSRRVRSAVGGRLRPARVSPCEDESQDHVNTAHFCDLEDGIQRGSHVVPASAGLASSPGVDGSRSAEERGALQRSGLGAHATTGESERIIGLRESDCSFLRHLVRLLTIHEFMVSHLVFVLARCPALLLVLLLHRLRLVFVPAVVHCLLLLCHACLWMSHPCLMQGIQGVPVVHCLCANPPGPTRRKGSKGGVSGRRFASCPRGGGRGKFSAGRRCTGAGCRFTSR